VFTIVFLVASCKINSEHEWLKQEDTQERLASLYEDDEDLENLRLFNHHVGFMVFWGFLPVYFFFFCLFFFCCIFALVVR